MMSKDKAIELARQAGFEQIRDFKDDWVCFTEEIERFYQLVIKHDREQLAKKIEKLPFGDTSQSFAVWVREQDV